MKEVEEHPGNMFGWKFSLIGLIIILLFLGIAIYRHYTLGVPTGFDDPMENVENQ